MRWEDLSLEYGNESGERGSADHVCVCFTEFLRGDGVLHENGTDQAFARDGAAEREPAEAGQGGEAVDRDGLDAEYTQASGDAGAGGCDQG